MAETKDEIAAERDALRADNDLLRAQLAAATTAGPAVAQHRFQLSEGDRAELVAQGRVNIGGKLLTADEVRPLLGPDQQKVVITGPAAE